MAIVSKIALMFGAAVLGIAALWHFYWAFGGTKGLTLAVPRRPASAGHDAGPAFQPVPAATGLVACAILVIAGLYAALALGAFSGTHFEKPATIAAALIGCVFMMRAIGDFRYVGLFKRVTGTDFAVADTHYYTPLCLILGLVGCTPAAARFL